MSAIDWSLCQNVRRAWVLNSSPFAHKILQFCKSFRHTLQNVAWLRMRWTACPSSVHSHIRYCQFCVLRFMTHWVVIVIVISRSSQVCWAGTPKLQLLNFSTLYSRSFLNDTILQISAPASTRIISKYESCKFFYTSGTIINDMFLSTPASQ